MEDDRYTDYMKLYTFIVNYGYPYIIAGVKEKYKKHIKQKADEERAAKALQTHVKRLLCVGQSVHLRHTHRRRTPSSQIYIQQVINSLTVLPCLIFLFP